MTALALQNSIPEVTIHDGKAITTSIAVAEYFHKRHDHVMEKIRAVMAECEAEWCLPNFREASREVVQPNGGVATYKCFELTRDAFVLIVMGFTGKKALQWKIDYINAFNRMENELYRDMTPASPSISEEEIDAYNVQALAKHYRVLYETWKNQIHPALRTLESPLAGRLHDRFKDGYAFLMYVEQAAHKRLKPGQAARIR